MMRFGTSISFWWLRAISTWFCFVLFGLVLPAHAAAQTQPFFDDLPDMDLFSYSGNRVDVYDPKDRIGLSLSGQTGGLVNLGLDQETALGFFGQGRLMFEAELSPTTFMRVDSTLAVPFEASRGEEGVTLSGSGLRGRHRGWGRLGIGRLREGAFGIDIDVDYRVDHSNDGRGFAGPQVAPLGFVDQRLATGITFRRGLDAYAALVMPVAYEWRRVDYPARVGGPPDAVTHELSSGIGFRDYTFAHLDGWFEIVGISWARTAFGQTSDCYPSDLVSGPGDAGCFEGLPLVGTDTTGWRPGGLNRLELRLAHFDHMIGRPDEHVLIGGVFFLGGSWLWDESDGRSAAMFIAGYGLEALMSSDEHRFGIGASISRRGDWTPGGQHIVAHHRAELLLEYSNLDLGMGMSHRATFDWIAHPEVDPEGTKGLPDAVPNHLLHTEWFFRLSELELGTYHQAGYGPRVGTDEWDPRAQERIWSHQIGVFLRLQELF